MFANYHTHTARCGHASGREEDYILRAIEGGIKILGFSDHIPFRFPDGHQSGFRVPVEQGRAYVALLSELREKYREQIEIHIGFEMEYYPLYFQEMLVYSRELGAEYLILGQHFIGNAHPNGRYVAQPSDSVAELAEYVDCVIAGMESGAFRYVAHPDVFRILGDRADYQAESRRLCAAAKKLDIPLEINFLGIRDHRHYPREDFWKIAGEYGCKAIFGFDSHTAEDAYDGASVETAMGILKAYNLELVEYLEFALPENGK